MDHESYYSLSKSVYNGQHYKIILNENGDISSQIIDIIPTENGVDTNKRRREFTFNGVYEKHSETI
jgi:hypothetical protein